METLAVCTTKNEAPYLLEWICYYRAIGFDKIIIATNDNSDSSVEILRKIESVFSWFTMFEHTVSERTAPQLQAYRIIKANLDKGGFMGYVALFDIDEFLVLPEGASMQDYLIRYKDADAVFINWRMYGSSGHLARPPGLVIEAYTRCAPISFSEHRKFKCIFRNDYPIKAFGVHWPYYIDVANRRMVFTDGQMINPLILTEKPYHVHSRICIEDIQLNHYSIKSKAEFEEKKLRGRGAKSAFHTREEIRHSNQYFKAMDRNEVLLPMRSDLVARTKSLMVEIYEKAGLASISPPEYFGIVDIAENKSSTKEPLEDPDCLPSKGLASDSYSSTRLATKPIHHMAPNPAMTEDVQKTLEPHFSAEMKAYFQARIMSSSVYLEYGCGGSTVYAAQAEGQRLIVSCENDSNYIDKVRAYLPSESLSRVRFVHVDLGPVGSWGVPIDPAMHNRGWQYQQRPWRILRRRKISPDFVLIDGRFRCACFLTCLIFAKPGLEIVVDDYLGRKNLSLISKYCQPRRFFDNSAQFFVPEEIDFRSLALDLARTTASAA